MQNLAWGVVDKKDKQLRFNMELVNHQQKVYDNTMKHVYLLFPTHSCTYTGSPNRIRCQEFQSSNATG